MRKTSLYQSLIINVYYWEYKQLKYAVFDGSCQEKHPERRIMQIKTIFEETV